MQYSPDLELMTNDYMIDTATTVILIVHSRYVKIRASLRVVVVTRPIYLSSLCALARRETFTIFAMNDSMAIEPNPT